MFTKFLLALHLWIHIHIHDPEKPGRIRGLAGDIVHIRTVQALIRHKDAAVIGDSRFMQFEAQVNSISCAINLSIAGSTGAQWRVMWRLALGCTPSLIFDDSAGNDFLGGADVETVFQNKMAERAEVIASGCKFLVWEVCYLGRGAFPGLNDKIKEYNMRIGAAVGADFIQVNDILSEGGFMKPEFDSGDHIHHSLTAWDKCYGPRMKERCIAAGFSV